MSGNNMIPKVSLWSRKRFEFIRFYDEKPTRALMNQHLATHFIEYPTDRVEVCVTPDDYRIFIGLKVIKVVDGLQFKIKRFMRRHPSQDEIGQFYGNHILPFDKRSITEILEEKVS